MICPRCQHVVLDERERDSIVIDVCRTCRGVWLDRGELDKLISRAALDYEGGRDDTPPRGIRYREDHDDDDYRRHPRRKRRWFESLGEVFD